MKTPLGRAIVRKSERETAPSVRAWAVIALMVSVLVVGGSPATAEQDDVQEQAQMSPLATQALVLDAAAVDGKLVVVGERGHILTSVDGGETWEQVQVPTRANLTGVYFHDGDRGWAVGHDSVILRTTDGGASWERVFWAPENEEPFFDVWFSDAENGIAIGAYGSYYTTADGGTNWDYQLVDEDGWHLYKIATAGDGRLYMAAEAGLVYRSEDGGANWIALPSPYEGSYFGVMPLDDEVVLLFGLRGHLFRSEDAGESWQEIDTGTVAMLTDGVRLGNNTVVLTGLGGTLLVSEDGGLSFELKLQSSRRGIQAAITASDDSLLLVGEFGVRMLPVNELQGTGGGAQ